MTADQYGEGGEGGGYSKRGQGRYSKRGEGDEGVIKKGRKGRLWRKRQRELWRTMEGGRQGGPGVQSSGIPQTRRGCLMHRDLNAAWNLWEALALVSRSTGDYHGQHTSPGKSTSGRLVS